MTALRFQIGGRHQHPRPPFGGCNWGELVCVCVPKERIYNWQCANDFQHRTDADACWNIHMSDILYLLSMSMDLWRLNKGRKVLYVKN